MRCLWSALRRWLCKPGKGAERQEKLDGQVPEGMVPVSLVVAGVMLEKRPEVALGLHVRQHVHLRREPGNQNDKHAIKVETLDGQQFGYIGRRSAEVLAPCFDAGHDPNPVLITEVSSDMNGRVISVTLGLYLPKDIAGQVNQSSIQDSDWFCEEGQTGAVYLLLNCHQAMLAQVIAHLEDQGLPFMRHGRSYHPALNGRQYRWFIRFGKTVSMAQIEQFCRDVLGIQPPPDDSAETEELTELFELADSEAQALIEKNTALMRSLDDLKAEHETFKCQVLEKERQVERLTQLPNDLLDVLLPNMVFKRDSLDVLLKELKSFKDVLGILRTLESDPQQVKCKRVQSAGKWLECHFNTGVANDGRLYFKQEEDQRFVLVSLKSEQKRDVQYLAKR